MAAEGERVGEAAATTAALSQARRRLPRATLNYFGEVARCGSVRQAADRLYVAASAVSRQISKLEQYVGTPLFDRRAGGMFLTDAGMLLAEYLTRSERELDRALAAIDDLRGLSSGEVSVATVEGMIDEFLPQVLEAFRQQFPAMVLTVRVGSALAVMESIAADEADVGISFNVPRKKNLVIVAQHAQPVVAVCAPGHPVASKSRVSLRALTAYSLAVQDTSFGTRRLLDDAFSRAKLVLEPQLVTNSLLLLKTFARQGGVVTFLPAFVVKPEVERGELVTVSTDSAILRSATLDLCVHGGRRLSSAAQQFLASTRSALLRLK